MIIFYKNSILASIVSILGCICILVVLMDTGSYDTAEIVPAVLVGIALLVCGKLLSMHKAFKTWWKQVEKAGLVERIKNDTSVAVAIYNKNPKKATLKKIESLNPAAAAAIQTSIAKK